MQKKTILIIINLFFSILSLNAENGHQLWLRNKNALPVTVVCSKNSPTLSIAKQELQQGWQGTPNAKVVLALKKDKVIKGDGFRLGENTVEANTEIGILYGVFELLRRQQTGEVTQTGVFNPSYEFRILDHWDNLNGSIERGYAGN